MNRVKKVNAIVCEYIAVGSNNKHNLINVYAGDILVREFPARVPFAFYIEVLPDFSGDMQAQIEVKLNNKRLGLVKTEINAEAGKPGLMVLPQLPVNITEQSRLKVVLTFDGHTTTLIDKSISCGPIPD